VKSLLHRIVLLTLLIIPAAAQVEMISGQGQVAVQIGKKPFTTFYFGPETPKPYLHPLRAASGTVVTRLYPMEIVAGESRDHPHHRGLTFSHGAVNGFNFWANEENQKAANTGRIVLEKLLSAAGGAQTGTIHAIFNWLDPAGKPILREDRTMTFLGDADNREIDFEFVLTAVDEVKFEDTKEGTFAIRLADALSEQKGGGKMTNAAGATGMQAVWGKPSPWVDYTGQVKGEKLGVKILDNPANPRYPTTWQARDYGLFAANPFGLHDFTGDKTKDGSMTIEAGKSVRFRYKVIIHKW
jgi:hypothetical protein